MLQGIRIPCKFEPFDITFLLSGEEKPLVISKTESNSPSSTDGLFLVLNIGILFFLASNKHIKISWISESLFEYLGTHQRNQTEKREKEIGYFLSLLKQMNWNGAFCDVHWPTTARNLQKHHLLFLLV